MTSSDFKIRGDIPPLTNTRSLYARHIDPHQWIEQKFEATFGTLGFSLEVKHFADQYDLSTTLLSPEVEAVLWISHGNQQNSPCSLLRKGHVYDWKGFEITPVFQTFHPELKLIAVISCYSALAVQNPERSDRNDQAENQLHVPYFLLMEREVILDTQLESIFSEAKMNLLSQIATARQPRDESPTFEEPSDSEGKQRIEVQLSVQRNCLSHDPNASFPAVRFELSGDVLGALPACVHNEVQSIQLSATITVKLPGLKAGVREGRTGDLNPGPLSGGDPLRPEERGFPRLDEKTSPRLVITSGTPTQRASYALGDFQITEISPFGEAAWNVLLRPNGKPLGTFQMIFERSEANAKSGKKNTN